MKKIEAIIKPFKLEKSKEGTWSGSEGITVIISRVFPGGGLQKGHTEI